MNMAPDASFVDEVVPVMVEPAMAVSAARGTGADDKTSVVTRLLLTNILASARLATATPCVTLIGLEMILG